MNETLTQIELHGPLGEAFGRLHRFAVSSPAEAVRALCSQFKGFREMFAAPGACYTVLIGDSAIPLEGIRLQTQGLPIHFVPVVEGAGRNPALGMLLVGAAIVAATVVTAGGFAALGTAMAAGGWSGIAYTTAFNFGLSLALSGAYNLIAPAPSLKAGSGSREQSSLFNGPANTAAQGRAIPIVYGELEVGSAVIASFMDYDEGSRFNYDKDRDYNSGGDWSGEGGGGSTKPGGTHGNEIVVRDPATDPTMQL
jgi:predicted phage tail protein